MNTLGIYQLSVEMQDFFDAIERGELTDEQCIKDTFESLELELADKVDDTVKEVKNIQRTIKAMKAECEDIRKRVQELEEREERYKGYVGMMIKTLPDQKLKTDHFSYWMQSNTSVEVDEDYPIDKIDDDYLDYKAPTVSKTRLKEALKNGAEFPFAKLVTKSGARWR